LKYAIQNLRRSAAPDPEVIGLAVRLARYRSAFDRDEETATLVACLY